MARALPWLGVLALPACDDRQSTFLAAGSDAAAIDTLFWVMLGAAVVLWLAMNGLFFYITRKGGGRADPRTGNLLVIFGGIVAPTLLIGLLLVWGLSLLPDQRLPGDGLRVEVRGEQWWWRVTYEAEDGTRVTSANEIRLPAGRRSEFVLESARVIHSFWIPALGGKMDMFPGRETRMSLEPLEPGLYRGQCAEFCGASHAWMAFETIVMPEAEFAQWLADEARDAAPPQGPEARKGARLFDTEGCGACHTIRGTPHRGEVGPDLTHVGSRHSLGAGRLGVTIEDFEAWIAHSGALKPEVRMPDYTHLEPEARRALAAYMKGLE